MAAYDIPAWIVLIFGIYSLSAGLGEWRANGLWARMVDEMEKFAALRFLAGIACLAIGAALYLIAPWGTGDWMAIMVKIIGGWMVIEGALFLAAPDALLALSRRMLTSATRLWAGLAILIGLALTITGLGRI